MLINVPIVFSYTAIQCVWNAPQMPDKSEDEASMLSMRNWYMVGFYDDARIEVTIRGSARMVIDLIDAYHYLYIDWESWKCNLFG